MQRESKYSPSRLCRARPFVTWALCLLAIILAASLPVMAAPDDFELDARAKEANPLNRRANLIMQDITVEQLESWTFQVGQNRAGWTGHCEKGLNARLAEIEAVEPFSEQQRLALKLAMQADIQKVMVQFDKLLEKHPPMTGGVDNEQWNAIHQDISPIRQQVTSGIFRKDSLFSKTFRQVASESQWNRLQELEKERRKKRWLLAVRLMVVQLEQACPMRHEQREALTKVLSERPAPPLNGETGSMYIAFSALANTPAEKWKTIFDAQQLPRIEKQVERYQGIQVPEGENDE
jgi:hypothetical protein